VRRILVDHARRRTVKRDGTSARAWLQVQLRRGAA
jgi:hypothetical protein